MDSPRSQAAAPMQEKSAFQHKRAARRRSPWIDRKSAYDRANPRAAAEDAFLALAAAAAPKKTAGVAEAEAEAGSQVSVLCLAGLWGHGRSVRRYIPRIASSKEVLRGLGSVGLVHGRDVARALLAMHGRWDRAQGERWILTNERL